MFHINRITLMVALLFIFTRATAQDTTASINSSLAKQTSYHFLLQSGLFLAKSEINKTSNTNLSYQLYGGSFKLAQEAKRNQSVTFSSEGIRTLKKLKLWGQFIFNDQQNDSIAFSHRVDNTDPAPYYYGSEKAVHYKRTNYTINTLAYIPLISQLGFALGFDYGMGNHASTNDPRGALKHFRLILKPEVIYHFGKHGISVKGTYGYGQNEYQVDYRNKAFYESTSYPHYLNRLMNGYGMSRTALDFSDRVFTIDKKWKGLEAYGNFKLNNGQLQTAFGYLDRDETFNRGNSDGRYASRQNYGHFDLETYYAKLIYQQNDWLFHLHWEKEKGKDNNYELGGNNYLYSNENAYLEAIKSMPKNWELGLKLQVGSMQKVDGNLEVEKFRSLAGIKTFAGKKLKLKDDLTWLNQVHLAYYTPLNPSFSYNPLKVNSFIRSVVLPDAVYDLYAYGQVSVASKLFYKKNRTHWVVGIDGQYTAAQKTSQNELLSAAINPGKNAYLVQLSLGLLF